MQKMVALTYKNKHFFLGEESILCCFLLFHFSGLQTQSMQSGRVYLHPQSQGYSVLF